MITHQINKYPEVVSHVISASNYISSLIPLNETNLKDMIEECVKKGYEIGKKFKFKWGGDCEIVRFRDVEKHSTSNIMVNKERPDILVVKRLTDNVIPAVHYNVTEIIPLTSQ